MESDSLGINFGMEDDLELVQLADQLGYSSIWVGEGQGRTSFGKLERWAVHTDSIYLATGIVNIYSRTPSTIAQAIATLDAHSEGRAILGLGVAHPGVIEAFHGVDFVAPLPRMKEYITLIRRYLAGDQGEFNGTFFKPKRTNFWEVFEPYQSDIPIFNAALSSTNIQLTGEFADGWLPYLVPRNLLEEKFKWLHRGLEKQGRSRNEIQVAMPIITSIHDDEGIAKARAKDHLIKYLTDIPGYYRKIALEAGFEDDLANVDETSDESAVVEAISDEFIDMIAITGDADEARAKLESFRDRGIDLPIVRTPMGISKDEMIEHAKALAPKG